MLIFGLTVALIGMGTVFVALVFLVGFINLMSWATGLSKRAKTPPVEPVTRAATAPAPVAVQAANLAGNDEEIRTVLAAAVAAYTQKT